MAVDLPTTMSGVLYTEYGESSVLKVVDDLPVPTPKDDEVLIRVRASGVNPVDWKLRKGFIPVWPNAISDGGATVTGWDLAGEVVVAGSAVTGLAVGDQVMSYCRAAWDQKDAHPECEGEKIDAEHGSTVQYAAVKAWKVAKKPAAFSMEEAAALPLAGLTAWQGLFDHGGLESGQTVLILNASGGVGSLAVQFAKAHGATVIGTCSAKNTEYVKGLGADRVVDYNTEGGIAAALDGTTIDLVYDAVGGDNTAQGAKALKTGGKLITIANMTVGDVLTAEGRDQTGLWMFVVPNAGQLNEMAALADSDPAKLAKPALTTMPMAEAAAAHDASETHRTVGKIVLTIP